jgi:hypothetical protein
MTAAGLLLGSCAGLLAARRLCAISTRKRAGEGGPEAAQASWEREGSLSIDLQGLVIARRAEVPERSKLLQFTLKLLSGLLLLTVLAYEKLTIGLGGGRATIARKLTIA